MKSMKRAFWSIVVLGLAAPFAHAAPLLISADVPTTETASTTTLREFQAYRFASPASYTLLLTVPGNPTLDGIHKMDKPQSWLFSVESPSDLAGALGGTNAEPRDVIRFDAGTGTYGFFFCGGAVGIPLQVNVDALYLEGGDTGDVIVSFDVPVTFGLSTFDPGDLVRYVRTGATCGDWALASVNPDFDASAAGIGIPTTSNLIGADRAGNLRILSFDVPTDLGPPGLTTYLPGQIVSWDGASFGLLESLAGWPVASLVDGLSCGGNPGIVPPTIKLGKTASPQLDTSDIVISWSASCSQGALDYGIYEGTLGGWYGHTLEDCSDGATPLTEQITPGAGAKYYLVVPQNGRAEGSYGKSRNFPLGFDTERPVGSAQCVTPRVITPCPP